MSNAFGITHVPSMYLIEPGGRVSWSSVGFFKRELLELAALAGRPIFADGEKGAGSEVRLRVEELRPPCGARHLK